MIAVSKLQDVRQTQNYGNFMRKIGWQVVKIKQEQIFIKKISPLPLIIVKLLRVKKLPLLASLRKLGANFNLLIIKAQPFVLEKRETGKIIKGFRLDKHPFIPTKTTWLDLTKDKAVLLQAMKQKTRYNINLARRKKIKAEVVIGDQASFKQLKEFYNLWQKNKPFNWLFKPTVKELNDLVTSFRKKCFFVFVYSLVGESPELIAANLILVTRNMAFYWHNCSSLLGRKLFAPSLAVWQAISQAKKQRLLIFDFAGIYDQRFPWLNKGWRGFGRFKKSFGGKEISFIKPLRAFYYQAGQRSR